MMDEPANGKQVTSILRHSSNEHREWCDTVQNSGARLAGVNRWGWERSRLEAFGPASINFAGEVPLVHTENAHPTSRRRNHLS
jgi:hypothetical protein